MQGGIHILDALILLLFLFNRGQIRIIAAVGLPFTEEMESECTQNRTEFAALTLWISVDYHVDLEHLTE